MAPCPGLADLRLCQVGRTPRLGCWGSELFPSSIIFPATESTQGLPGTNCPTERVGWEAKAARTVAAEDPSAGSKGRGQGTFVMEAGATKQRKEKRVRQGWSPAQGLAMGSTDTPDPLVCWQSPKRSPGRA